MIVSDLDYLENLESAPIQGGFTIGTPINVAFIALVEQDAEAFSGASSKSGDATAIAIARNESNITFGGFPIFS